MGKKSGKKEEVPRCSDYDDECQHVDDYVRCFLHDPIRGYCPYLRKRESEDG